MSIARIDADPDAGFHYPYYLRVPDAPVDEPRSILVEPTCSGRPTDEFEDHLDTARTRIEAGMGKAIADALSVPLLHPVFPRPATEPVDWTHYVHSLDAETMRIDGAPLERVDLQLLAMVDDARDRLSERGFPVGERFSMNGFSASGVFANRFAALHPERVRSVTAGGINGMAILPVEEAKGHALPYPVGVANLESLTGDPFDLEAFREVRQFLYVGEDDERDTLLYPDAWTGTDVRKAAVLVYGEDVHDDRFPYCASVHDEVGAAAVFRTYESAGHTPRPAKGDLIEFHERCLAGNDVESIRADLGGI